MQGSSSADDAETYRQAGALLAAFHQQATRVSHGDEAEMDARSLPWLDSDHRISPETEAQLRRVINSHDQPATDLVPTHGDWQEGYGADPREVAAWARTLLREAIGTACKAHQVGDVLFEQQGHRMIEQALAATDW